MISLISTWRLIGWNVKEVGGFLVGLCIWDDDSPVWLIGLENGSLNDSFIVLECGHSFKYHYCNGQYSIYIHLWLYIYTHIMMIYLVAGLEHEFYDFPYIGNVIIPTDELIFFRGVGIPPTRIRQQLVCISDMSKDGVDRHLLWCKPQSLSVYISMFLDSVCFTWCCLFKFV